MDDHPQAAPSPAALPFLAGGGAMGERIRAFDWAAHPLGDPRRWPQGLRTALRVMLTTQHPVFIFWGAAHVCFYNDAYACSLGPEKHPAILGARGVEAWPEIWPIISPQIEQVLQGRGATFHKDQLVPIVRHGALQDVYWTYSYSPIDEPDAPNGVGGVLVICTETTEYVLAERRLRRERERFVQLFDQAPTFLAVLEGPQHVIRLANAGYKRLLGGRPVVGRTVADAIPEAVSQGFVVLLDEVYRSGRPYTAQGARFTAVDAATGAHEAWYLDFIYQPITEPDGAVTGILVQGVDVTARAVADRALALNRARLDYATRLSGIGFFYCDLPFDELQWDERVKEHFFFPPDARITIDDFYARIHPDDRAATRAAIETSIASRMPYDVVYRTVCPRTGAVKWIRALGGTDYAADGTPTHFDGVTVDVTAQKRDEQRLAALNDELRAQDRRKDAFIATLSHELRNPLMPILSAAQVIVSPQAAPAQVLRAQQIVSRQVRQMALLLDDLLDIARVTEGKLRLRWQVVVLAQAVEAAVEAVRPALERKRQSLVTDLPDRPVEVRGDPLRLSQIVSNLLTNAVKYSPPGSRVDLAVALDGDAVVLSVADQGIGIAPEHLVDVFRMFAQVDGDPGPSEGGLGIGLALVKGLVELHGGTVEARSAGRGHGSRFVVRLPLPTPLATEAGGGAASVTGAA